MSTGSHVIELPAQGSTEVYPSGVYIVVVEGLIDEPVIRKAVVMP
jgi:hypothetical protein